MPVNDSGFETLFTAEVMRRLFPPSRADAFFDALFGDAGEGAYDIFLVFTKAAGTTLYFQFELHQRPGKCLRCNLTYGLPEVFKRHPVIAMPTVIQGIDEHLDDRWRCSGWTLGRTREISRIFHVIPLVVDLRSADQVGERALP